MYASNFLFLEILEIGGLYLGVRGECEGNFGGYFGLGFGVFSRIFIEG